MIKIDKNTNKELVVVTSPNCYICKTLNENEYFNSIPLTKTIILVEFTVLDKMINNLIWKAYDPYLAYTKLLSGKELLDSEIDYTKDISTISQENQNYLKQIQEKYTVIGVPMFFIRENGQFINQIDIPTVDMALLMINSLKTYI